MPASYVKPYVKRGKSGLRDAEAICEAVQRPNMRFVPIKTVEQQIERSLERARELLVKQPHAADERSAQPACRTGHRRPPRVARLQNAGGQDRGWQ